MNKNEMVKIMWDFIESVEFDCDCYMTENDTAELLEKMLEAGMLPPRLPGPYCQAIMDIYYGGYSFNQWEEDVQKNEQVMASKARRENG